MSGWSHDFTFYAYKEQIAGTVPVAVGHAECEHGWKYRLASLGNKNVFAIVKR